MAGSKEAKVARNKQKEEFKKKLEKTKEVRTEDHTRQLATRQILERDYNEDFIRISFNTSPETRRTILSKKPNQEEFIKLLTLYIKASSLGVTNDPTVLQEFVDVYKQTNKLAAELTVDDKLDENFWAKYSSFETLQSFLAQLLVTFQTGGAVPEDELQTFR